MNILSVWDQTAILDLLTEGKRSLDSEHQSKTDDSGGTVSQVAAQL